MLGLAAFAARGPMQAGVLAGLAGLGFIMLPLLLPLLPLSGAAIALTAMRRGWVNALSAAGIAVLLVALVFAGLLGDARPALMLALILWLPVIIEAEVLRASVSLRFAILVAAGLGGLALLSIYLVLGDPVAWWTQQLQVVRPSLEQALGVTGQAMNEWIEVFATRLTVGLAMSVTLFSVLSLLLARWWQAQQINPGGFREEFHALSLGRPAALATLACLAVAGISAYAPLIEFAEILLMVFALQGLAVTHNRVASRGMNTGWLIGLYVFLLALTGPVAVFLSLFGLLDNWANLRHRR